LEWRPALNTETSFVLLFVVATAVAIGARRFRLPYTVALVLAGLVLGIVHLFEPPNLTKELLYAVFLPGLLFEAAFHLEFRDFWRDRTAIAALAVPGVAAAIALTAVILEPIIKTLSLGAGFGWSHAIVFGALIAATDPIAVVGMFKTLGAPRRLSLLLEGESLLNDGTAIVLFSLVLDVVSGGGVSALGLVWEFVRVVGGGLAVGILIGLGISQVIKQIDDPMIEITLTTLAAYGSFLAAEQFHFSGVIATVTAGMLCGNYAARTGMSPTTRIAAETFWEYIAFALNSIVFLLVGLRVHIGELVDSWALILAAYAAVTLARAGVVFLVSSLNRANSARSWPAKWGAVLTWGGMRGGLSMVLALALPPALAQRDLLVTVTFGVVLLSILLQGLTMGPLLRRLGIVERHEARQKYHLKRGELRMTQAALAEVERMERLHLAPPAVLKSLREEYEGRVSEATQSVEALQLEQEDLRAEEETRARRHVLLAEKEEVLNDYHRGTLTADAYEQLLGAIDARLSDVDSGGSAARHEDEEKKPEDAEEEAAGGKAPPRGEGKRGEAGASHADRDAAQPPDASR
jgi:CPA1 family monovalent cation:H+ antiporter